MKYRLWSITALVAGLAMWLATARARRGRTERTRRPGHRDGPRADSVQEARVQAQDEGPETSAEPMLAGQTDRPQTATAPETGPASSTERLLLSGKATMVSLREAAAEWASDKAPRQAAALSFYTMLALSPLLIIAIGIAGLVLGGGETQRQVIGQVEENAGLQVADAVETVLANASRPGASVTAFIVGGILLLFGASGAIRQLKGALNVIWDVEPIPPEGMWRKIRVLITTYLRHFGLVIVCGIGLLALLVTTAAWGWVAGWVLGSLAAAELLLRVFDFGVTLALLTLIIAAIFKGLPDVEIQWRELWVGAFATALLFDLGRLAIGLYVSSSATTSVYGAAGSVVALLLWVYYSALIIFFGAELTQVHARRHGARLAAKQGARAV